MLRKHIAACFVTTALMAVPAMAQTTQPMPSTNMPSSNMSTPMSTSSDKVMTQAQPNEWRTSKLIGVDIYGPDNQKVGDVNEVLIDRSGQVKAVVVGVGGFLGIGEKDVAIPFDQVQWSNQPRNANTTAANTTTAPANPNAPATTGAVGTVNTPANNAANADNRMYPDHGMITMTKDQLKNAPAFHYASDTNNNAVRTTAPMNNANPPGTAPKQ